MSISCQTKDKDSFPKKEWGLMIHYFWTTVLKKVFQYTWDQIIKYFLSQVYIILAGSCFVTNFASYYFHYCYIHSDNYFIVIGAFTPCMFFISCTYTLYKYGMVDKQFQNHYLHDITLFFGSKNTITDSSTYPSTFFSDFLTFIAATHNYKCIWSSVKQLRCFYQLRLLIKALVLTVDL